MAQRHVTEGRRIVPSRG